MTPSTGSGVGPHILADMSWRSERIIRNAARVLVFAAAFATGSTQAATYDVGPGQPLAAIGDVPWVSLGPGDEVRIHWRPQPYREKWVIGRAGTAAAPIVVRGIPGPGGERPIISGDGATTPDPLDFTNDQRGVIKIGSANVPQDTIPRYIVLENLEIRGGHPSYQFTDDSGMLQTYSTSASSIWK